MISIFNVAKKEQKGRRTSLGDPITAEDRTEMDELLKQLEGVDPKDLIKKITQETEQYNKELRAKAKNPEQLTVGLECVVKELHYHQHSISFTPSSEIVLGGHSRSYGGGHANSVELLVESNSLVTKLQFRGWPHLEAGDTIRAYILKGKKEPEKCSFGSFRDDPFNQGPKIHLVERDYQPVEQPSKIEKLRDGKVVATYHNR